MGGNFTGSNLIKKNQACVPPRPAWGKRGKRAVWFSVCGAPLDDWANGGYVDVLFMCSVVLILSAVGLYTLNILDSSLSIIQQEIFKKINLVVHTWDERNLYFYLETKET